MIAKDFARHGDLNFRKVSALPKELIRIKGNVLAEGEFTGHKHVITKLDPETTVELYKDSINKLYIKIEGGKAQLTHQEHKKIVFDEGIWEMDFEREYDYFLEEVKQVQD